MVRAATRSPEQMVDNEIAERQKQLNKTAVDARKNVEEIEYAFG